MMSPEERLERILKAIDELESLSEEMPIVVEGKRDVEALGRMGIAKNVVSLSKGISVFAFCESLTRNWNSVVILTDWDRKGGRLARKLKEAVEANGARPIESIRTQLAYLAKKEVKDVESIPTFVQNLRNLAGVKQP
ncbi:MAG: toprim domain-containing protein [Methanobacteriota archaeon]|nr:MAG: toprim domain-containing protein [Euryarchaeota archaeon]